MDRRAAHRAERALFDRPEQQRARAVRALLRRDARAGEEQALDRAVVARAQHGARVAEHVAAAEVVDRKHQVVTARAEDRYDDHVLDPLVAARGLEDEASALAEQRQLL